MQGASNTDLECRLRQATSDLERSYDLTLEAFGDALYLKHPATAAHSKRVTSFTICIARAMALSADQIRVIARGAFLHDLGKLAVPDEILRKTGALSPEELAIMRLHCARGRDITAKLPFLKEPAEIIFAHHENYDGSGYPRGIRGGDIPLGARIVSLANAFDAITTDQPHRAARSFGEAVKEIQRCSGSQFDPEIAGVFFKVPEGLWSSLRKELETKADARPSAP